MRFLLEYLEDFSFEDQLYWSVENSSHEKIEIFWQRKNSGPSIWFTKYKDSTSTNFTSNTFEDHLIQLSANTTQLYEQLKTTILTMACFSSNLINQAKVLLGEETIEKAIMDHNHFSQQLLEAIVKQTSPTKRTPLKILKKVDD